MKGTLYTHRGTGAAAGKTDMEAGMRYFLSTNGDLEYSYSHPGETGPCAALAAEYGVGLELAEFCIHANLEENYAAAQDLIRRKQKLVPEAILHAPFSELCPSAIEPMIREVSAKRYGQSLELAERFHAEKIVIHSGFVPSLYYKEYFIPESAAFWKRFLKEHPDTPELVLENVMEDEPEMLLSLVKAVDHEKFRLCLDVGHANLMPVSPEDWIRTYGPLLSHLHIHNNKGPVRGGIGARGDTHSALNDGIIDMEKVLRLAGETVPEATVTVETVYGRESLAWLREKAFI